MPNIEEKGNDLAELNLNYHMSYSIICNRIEYYHLHNINALSMYILRYSLDNTDCV